MGGGRLMSLQEVFPVSHSVMPGSAEARQMTATSGRLCTNALTRSDQLGSLLRMLLESSRWSSKAVFLKWKVRQLFSERVTDYTDTSKEKPLPLSESAEILRQTDMRSSRFLFQLAVLERPTDGTECSSSDTVLLQTPTSVQTCEAPEKMGARARARGYKNGTKYGSLTSQIKYDPRVREMFKLPTPTTRDWKGTTNPGVMKSGSGCIYGETLPDAVKRLFPTPLTRDYKGGSTAIRKDTGKVRTDALDSLAKCMAESAGLVDKDGNSFRLSPLFTEEMMGFPLMWTALPYLLVNGEQKPSKPTATR